MQTTVTNQPCDQRPWNRVRSATVILEGFEVGIHIQDVRALEVDEGWRGVGFAGTRTRAHHVLDALVEQRGGHDHTISLAVVGNEFEYGSR